jgi:ABC-2 type transport system permease protein
LPPEPPRSGVIHDIGYRPYSGLRLTERRIAWALFVTGLRNAFGLGRSGKSKILPFVLLGLNLVPAVIMVTIMVVVGLDEPPVEYAGYAAQTQALLSVFAASQAPILFSRDLRYGSIVLYLARPLRSSTFALTRWASLMTALLVFLVTPILVLYVGALLNESDVSEQTTAVAGALVAAVLLAGMLASVTGVISAWTTRRGIGVVASIAVLLFGYGVIAAVQGIASSEGADQVGEYAGLLAPYSLYRGIAASVLDTSTPAIAPPSTTFMEVLYLVVALLVLLGGLAALTWRYRKVGAR